MDGAAPLIVVMLTALKVAVAVAVVGPGQGARGCGGRWQCRGQGRGARRAWWTRGQRGATKQWGRPSVRLMNRSDAPMLYAPTLYELG